MRVRPVQHEEGNYGSEVMSNIRKAIGPISHGCQPVKSITSTDMSTV